MLAFVDTQWLLLIKFVKFFLLPYKRLRQSCDQLCTCSVIAFSYSFKFLLNFVWKVIFYHSVICILKYEKLLNGLWVGDI